MDVKRDDPERRHEDDRVQERGNPDALRADIDSGRTHDKVAKSDPAAAPLGTDAEAGGTPPTAEQVDMAHRQETARTVSHEPSASRVATQQPVRKMPNTVWIIAAVVVVAVVIALLF